MTEINNREPLVSSPISIMGNAPEVSMRSQRLDYNRGVVMVHGSHGVVAYYPDEPGRYLNVVGGEVTEEEARRAGIDTLTQGTERRRKDARDKAFAAIEAQYQAEKTALEAQALAVADVAPEAPAPDPVYTVPSKDADAVAEDGLRSNKKAGA
jgi:hypothetical protein